MEGRIPPYDAEAEQACLGAVLLNNDALPIVRTILRGPEDFYLEANRIIFAAMTELTRKGSAVDAVTLGGLLKENGDLEKCGGPMVMSKLTDSVATVANVGHYAKIVRDRASVRRMIFAAQQIVADGFGRRIEDVPTYLADARKAITVASATDAGDGPVQLKDDLHRVFSEIESGKMPGGLVGTGIDVIDELTGGLWPGLLTIIGARPSMGKSALCLNIVTNCALQGRPALYVPTEDAREYVVMRELARFGNVDLNDLMLRSVHDSDWKGLIDGMNKLHDLPLWVDDTPGLSSDRIAQIAALHKQVHGLDLLVVDHLGELTDDGDNQTQSVENAAKGLRDIAKELQIPVLLACQLNRQVENRKDKRPTLYDLRQSGAIEQIARVVWFMYRRGYYRQGCEDDPDTQLIVAKATHGKTGTIRLWADMARMYLRGWDTSTDGVFPDEDSSGYAPPPKQGGSSSDHRNGFFDNTGPPSRVGGGKHWTDDY